MSLQCQTSAPGSAASYHQDQVTSAEILAANQRHSRPDPRTVILVIFVLNALVMSRLPIVITFLVAGIALLALLLSRCYSWALGFLAVEGTWVACIYLFPRIWPSALTAFLMVLGYWMIRICTVGGLAGYAIKTIVPGELVAGLRSLRIPIAVTVPLVVLLRFIPTVFREYRAVREAMSLRGLQMGWRALLYPLHFLEMVLVPLLASCARTADEMTAAGMVRGLGSTICPSTLKQLRFNRLDALWILTLIALIALIPYSDHLAILSGGFK